jgi:thiol-disulfide isomerase/thioredoxin
MSTSLRRQLLLGGVGLAALGTGGWLAWRRSAPASTPSTTSPATSPAPTTPHPAEAGPAGLWSKSFDSPAGGSLRLAEHRGHPIVLNFWATWCPPCVQEIPTLDRFHREFGPRGWRVLGLAIDGPTPVRAFLAKTPVAYPIGLAGMGGTELAQSLGNQQGGLPFTVVLGADGEIKARKLGPCEFADLTGWAQQFG